MPWWVWPLSLIGTPGVPPNLMGCALIYFETKECDILIREKMDPEVELAIREHERLHCQGRDHVNSTALRDGWDKFKSQRP